ncbi:ABC transporter related protein [Paracholeplasma brassicae]|uniref:ABC transporter related protein n=1 Tax=Acholeplasma brassicae TaxID=61635 RepID=U4KQ27_9MOLU|nr:ABC transporter ATP-binding protein [Paracholeplasma brassicae]CCV66627.1 ABC transporter related protein [Paracholeplasma brassicae]
MRTIKNFLFVLKEIYVLQKSYLVVNFFYVVFASMKPISSALVIKIVIDGLIEDVELRENLNVILLYLLLISSIEILQTILGKYLNEILSTKLKDKLKLKFCDKVKHIDNSAYENPEYYNVMTRTMANGDSRYIAVSDTFFNFFGSILVITGLTSLIIVLNITLIYSVLIFVVLKIIISSLIKKLTFDEYISLTRSNRYIDYFTRLFRLPTFINEIKLFPLEDVIRQKHIDESNQRLLMKMKFKGKQNIYNVLNNVIDVSFMGFVIIFLVIEIGNNRSSVGDFAALMNSTQQLGMSLVSFLLIIPNLKEHNRYINDMKSFLEYKGEIETNNGENLTTIDKIEFKDVSFCYPNTQSNSLNNINITIHKGSKIALVGHNGAGKSTLIKLILRFFDPVTGVILINDKNLKLYNANSYRNHFGVIFQNYQVYSLSIEENILLRTINSDERIDVLWESLNLVELADKVNSLPLKEKTILSKEFSEQGTILSGGEQQKVAIARLYSINKDVVILDEASSALDPYTEHKINNMLLDSFKDKTVIIISHRLSITKNVDKIFMIENGNIIEQGNHKELIKMSGGKYAEMYNLQANNYK